MNRSTASRFWKIGLHVAEIALCIIVPFVGIVIWTLFDDELREGMLARTEKDPILALNPVHNMISTGNGTAMAVHLQGQIQFWDIPRSICFDEIQSRLPGLRCAAYSDHQRLLAVGSLSGQLEIWDLDHLDKPVAISGPIFNRPLLTCEFTPDGSLLCSGDGVGNVVFWEPRTLRKLWTLRNSDADIAIRSIKFTQDGKFLLAGDNCGSVHVWNLGTRSVVHTLNAARPKKRATDSPIVVALSILPGDRECVIVTRSQGISIWNLSTATCLHRWGEDLAALIFASLSSDGKRIVTSDVLGEIRTWETATGRQIKSVPTRNSHVHSLAVTDEGTFLIIGDILGEIRCMPY